MPFACVRYGRAHLASTARLGVAQFRMKVAAPLGREVEHIPKRVEGIVVTVFLAGLRWHVKDFRSPEMVNAVAIAQKNVSRGRLGHLGLSAHAGTGAQRGSDEPACVSVQLNRSCLLPSSPSTGMNARDYAKVSSSLRFGSAPQIGCAILNSPHAAVRSTAHRSVVASFRSGSAIRP